MGAREQTPLDGVMSSLSGIVDPLLTQVPVDVAPQRRGFILLVSAHYDGWNPTGMRNLSFPSIKGGEQVALRLL